MEGGVVKYSRNGEVLYLSSVAPVYPLRLDASLMQMGATVTEAVIAGVLDTSSAPEADTTPPALSRVASSGVTATWATITWETNEASDAQVEYGPTTAYGTTTPLNLVRATSHAQALDGLTPETAYHFRVRSRDAAGNLAVSGDFTLTTAAPAAVEAVIWTDLVNAAAAENALRKTSGCDGCDDAGAVSQQQIASGDGYVEFSTSEADTLRAVGLSHGSATTAADEIDYAIRLQLGLADVYERGVYRAGSGFIAGDVFRVAVEGGVVNYYKNGGRLYTSAVPPTYPLVLDASLFDLSAAVTDAVISTAPAQP